METIGNTPVVENPPVVTGKTPTRKAAKKVSRIVTATLPLRQIRIVFRANGKNVYTSRVYKSKNVLAKIVAFARVQAKGAASGAKAIAQVTEDGKKFVTVTE